MAGEPSPDAVDGDLLAIRRASRRMARADDTERVAEEFVATCASTLGVELAAVRGYDPRCDALGVTAATDAAEPYLDGWSDHRRGDDGSPAWRAYVTGETVAVAEPATGSDAEPVEHALYIPLGPHGVATVATLDEGGFDDRTTSLLETLASDVTAALDAAADRRGLRGLHDATRTMQAADDPEAIVAAAVDATETVLNVPYSGARLHDPDGDSLPLVAVSDAAAEDVGVGRDDAGERVARDVLDSGEASVSEGNVGGAAGVTLGATAVYPLGDHGTLSVALPEGMPLDGRRRELARVLADNTAAALDRADRAVRLREQASTIAAQDERLEEFANVVSHDLRNPLNVATGRVDLARDRLPAAAGAADGETDAVDAVDGAVAADVAADLETAAEALDRVADIIDNARALAVGEQVDQTEALSVGDTARTAWEAVETGEAALLVEDDRTVDADTSLFAQLFENVFANAVEHAGDAPSVLVTGTDTGFAVEDDGPGVPDDERGAVFRVGYSGADGTGLGLGIVARVAETHGWTVRVEDGDRLGGARFVVEV
ncbi:sensor histidine kinase [Halobaculum lipolyticum]|uniref:histidine kinase n=1 Tax=Halobaculum lipolyticum TaxID=3032001 RepID=A0ABD5WE80_9EURY|nr:GAF domain-containing protein [Halobaculum sp. DT31]